MRNHSIATLGGSINLVDDRCDTCANKAQMFTRNILPLVNYPSGDIGTVAITAYSYGAATPSNTPIMQGIMDSFQSLHDVSTWLIKRTFQPSLVRKRRKHGFLRRTESVGGRRVLKRRRAKGRMRLGGS